MFYHPLPIHPSMCVPDHAEGIFDVVNSEKDRQEAKDRQKLLKNGSCKSVLDPTINHLHVPLHHFWGNNWRNTWKRMLSCNSIT